MTDETKETPPVEEPTASTNEAQADDSLVGQFVKHQRKAADEACKAVNALIPPDFRTHGRAAREEFLASFKVVLEGVGKMVDTELDKMRSAKASDDTSRGPSTTGKAKVKVEVS